MKRLLISLIALQLTACLSGGSGGSPVATIALAPEEPSEPVVPPADPGPAPTQPSFNLNYFSTKSLTSAYGSISISNGLLTDAYCGHVYPVISQSEANGVVTVAVDGWSGSHQAQSGRAWLSASSSFTDPGHQGCQVNVLPLDYYLQGLIGTSRVYFSINGMLNGQPASFDMAYRVTYTFELVGSTVVVKRSLTTRPYRRGQPNSSGQSATVEASVQAADMNYNLQ